MNLFSPDSFFFLFSRPFYSMLDWLTVFLTHIKLTTLWVFSIFYSSGVAQLAEQMTVNHRVAGSSPAAGAKFLPI